SEKKKADGDKRESLARERKLSPQVTQRWREFLEKRSKAHDPIFAPWFELSRLAEDGFDEKAKALDFSATSGTNALNPLVAKVFSGPVSSLKEAAERYNHLFAEVDKKWKELAKEGGLKALPDSDAEALRQVLYASDAPPNVD